ncbi:ERC protein 2-like isoform X1 [Synchiropus splendidus]|uniref:ERC protein 2-like isoform X1 n=1 Tax=Synchiropus splendidus TaxID=270530 RepID=UPI00237EE2F7|nr:ERC protein 2-like isoform X1 [Synchiropus splendidus]
MPLNIRAKPTQSKLSAGTKSSGFPSSSSSHSRLSRLPKHGKAKHSGSSVPGCRSGLEPGSVSGGLTRQAPKVDRGSVSRIASKAPAGNTTDKKAALGSATAPGGKTLSMENIQSISAAYATSGTMYPSEQDALELSGGYPRGTMTLGRSTTRSSKNGRSTVAGSSPNIHSSMLHPSPDSCGDQTLTSPREFKPPAARYPPPLDLTGRSEGPSFELQVQLRDLQRENDPLRRELDGGREARTGHSSNNVNFWSSDMKRDKAVRREDGVRSSILKDHHRMHQEDVQHPLDSRRNKNPLTLQELQEELRAHREMNSRLQHQRQIGNSGSCRDVGLDQDCRGRLSPGHSPSHIQSLGAKSSPRISPSNTYNQKQQEADIIIHSPGYGGRTTLNPHCVSPANSLQPGTTNSPNHPSFNTTHSPVETLSSGWGRRCSPCQVPGCDGFCSSPPLDPSEDNYFRLQSEHERQAKELSLLRKTMEEMEVRIDSQKQTLGSRDESIQRLLEMLQAQGHSDGTWGRSHRASIVSMATQEAESHLENNHMREDTKISSLERNIRDLEDEVQMLKTSGLLHPDDRQDELKQVEVYKSHSKFMKTKIDQLKQEQNRKEAEMQTLQTKLETLTNQNSDCKQHIEVLKESLSAKEQRANTLQTEVDALRVRLEEKEQFLTKKTKQIQDLTDEKSTLTGEIRDMKDMLDVKERKVNVLQKKIDNLLEQLKDKDKQLAGLRERVQGLQTDSSNTDTALATLEEALSEKERVIENLREQKEREEKIQLEEMERLRKENQELKDKCFVIQPPKLPQPSSPTPTNPRMEIEVPVKADVLPPVNPLVPNKDMAALKCTDITDRLRLLEQEVARYREESGKSQAEVDRLMAALRDAEKERHCKEKKIVDLERQIRSPNIQKQIDVQPHTLSQLEELMGALEKTRQELDTTKLRLSSTQQSLHERDGHLNSLRHERRKQLEEILEMKQQALLAAISEKDANIALLELSSSKRKKAQDEVMALKREKDRLMHQLKQQTQSRMKMITDNYEEDHAHPQHHHPHHLHPANVHHRSLPRGHLHANHRPPLDQDDEEGIWA